MDLRSSPRHSRRGFIQKVNPGNLATALSKSNSPQLEVIDFSSVGGALADEPNNSIAARKASAWSKRDLNNNTRHSAPASKRLLGQVLAASTCSYRINAHTESMSDGTRRQTFDNGSLVKKDALGRVLEIYSSFAECLFLTYDNAGELSSFIRTNARGSLHSTGNKGQHGVIVRDAAGRVKAVGEFMTVDPWGRFYLHTNQGQFFSVDLVHGVHCERRRIVNQDGRINFVTAVFAHDGFRMATVYARARQVEARCRQVTYRFYGRDGTVVEFGSEDAFRHLNASRSMAPGSFPVNESWMRRRQAHTAWESVNEYLSRELVQALAP